MEEKYIKGFLEYIYIRVMVIVRILDWIEVS